MENLLTLDQFMERSVADLAAFAAATRSYQSEGAEGFIGPQYELRTREDWWREVAAYFDYVEMSDTLRELHGKSTA